MISSPRAFVCRIRFFLPLLAFPGLLVAQTPNDAELIRSLQAENAALRKRVAELERLTATTDQVPSVAQTDPQKINQTKSPAAAPSSPLPENESELSPVALSLFEVKGERDHGYLRTNATTATRIGMEIQRVPMAISVLSEDFIRDTGITSITDVLRYTASGSPDSRFAMRVPGNVLSPQGNFTLRGFTVNSLLRNGVLRYTAYNLDNVDRVEVVKGPAAVFFGEGYPGGVINYVTKKPIFNRPATTLSYAIDNQGGDKVMFDHNAPLSPQAALRIVGSWSDLGGDRWGEFRQNTNLTPSLTLIPFSTKKLQINLEFEYLKETYNQNDGAWLWPQGWFDAYANPSPELIAASGVADANAYRARIFNSVGSWMADVRKSTNDPGRPLVIQDSVKAAGFYTDAAGRRVEDKGFNFTNAGAFTQNEVKTLQATVEATPFSWMEARYVYTNDNDRFDNIFAAVVPNADGVTFDVDTGGGGNGYYRHAKDHQLDLVFKADFWGMKHKFLTGGLYQQSTQRYLTSTGAVYFLVPGYNYPTVNPNSVPDSAAGPNVPVNQVMRNRSGTVLTPQQVYSQWDPGLQVQPPTTKIRGINRNQLDGYKPENDAYYLNWQIQTWRDRLTLLAGYRHESTKGNGQWLIANDPWFVTPPDAYNDPATYPPDVYNYSPSYAGDPENFRRRHGRAWMGGVSFSVRPEITLYATVSKTFKINNGLAAGFDERGLDALLSDALANNGGSFSYRGTTVSSIAEGRAALAAAGGFRAIQNEDGMNYEVGMKTNLWDEKLVSTLSLFRGTRNNQKLDDVQRITEDPFNASTTMFGPKSPFYNRRNLRWRTVGVENQIEGIEMETIWSPRRNYQILVNGAWLWQATTLNNPANPKPGTAAFSKATPAQQAFYSMYYENRIENVPEFRLNVFNKYTFTSGVLNRLSAAFGGRYSSETVFSRSIDWNPSRGGFMAGDYLVFDANFSYPWQLFRYRVITALGINNLFDQVYYEGSYAPSDGRSWVLRTTLTF